MGTTEEALANAEKIGFISLNADERDENYSYGDLNRFPAYFSTHPKVMEQRIKKHPLSIQDLEEIKKKYWWYPPKIFNIRYKSGVRVKEGIK